MFDIWTTIITIIQLNVGINLAALTGLRKTH